MIGPKGSGKPDLIVEPTSRVNWQVFDAISTGAGYNWPRFLAYEGNDVSIFDWLKTRETERLTFRPCADLTIDMSDARLDTLEIEPRGYGLRLTLPIGLRRLAIKGDPSVIDWAHTPDFDNIQVKISASTDFDLTSLHGLKWRENIRYLGITRAVVGDEGFDCASLTQCKILQFLRLYGGMRNLEALSQLPLQGLELRFVPDLSSLPNVSGWPLQNLVAWNVDEARGNQLVTELKSTGNEVRISQLRSKAWFVAEHGLPFAAWPKKNEKPASKAFKSAAKHLSKANAPVEAKAVIKAFADAINALDGIETSEREDAAEAVRLLAETRPDLISAEQAQSQFDVVRRF
ncbi:hypothetical protein [Tianweitania sp.]|uniref:hypothetical protein n=1 Tax=Tianweitania sp. TaxID=2021634 RepID=UPI00289E4A40|nr:hypothetical protein [Tianweitania sp.]